MEVVDVTHMDKLHDTYLLWPIVHLHSILDLQCLQLRRRLLNLSLFGRFFRRGRKRLLLFFSLIFVDTHDPVLADMNPHMQLNGGFWLEKLFDSVCLVGSSEDNYIKTRLFHDLSGNAWESHSTVNILELGSDNHDTFFALIWLLWLYCGLRRSCLLLLWRDFASILDKFSIEQVQVLFLHVSCQIATFTQVLNRILLQWFAFGTRNEHIFREYMHNAFVFLCSYLLRTIPNFLPFTIGFQL